MTTKAIKCDSCDAPLDVPTNLVTFVDGDEGCVGVYFGDSRFIKCEYCNTSNKLSRGEKYEAKIVTVSGSGAVAIGAGAKALGAGAIDLSGATVSGTVNTGTFVVVYGGDE